MSFTAKKTGGMLSKSQTLPRSMGRPSSILSCHRPSLTKTTLTPPISRKQVSTTPLSEPVVRRRPTTPNSNKGTPVRRIPSLKGIDPKLAQLIIDEILEGGAPVHWDDIAGQEVLSLNYKLHDCCFVLTLLLNLF